MSYVVNVLKMPVVINIISDAQFKIKKITGCDIELQPVNLLSPFHKPEILKLRKIIEEQFETTWPLIISPTRKTNARYARYIYSWVCVKIFKQTLEVTGNELGARDHTTILHGISVLKKHIESKDMWAKRLDKIIELCNTP